MYRFRRNDQSINVWGDEQHLKLFVETQLVTFSEAAEWLQVTRETFRDWVEEGKIRPFTEHRGQLFHWRDVRALRRDLGLGETTDADRLIDEHIGVTRYSRAFFEENRHRLDKIDKVFIYKNDSDAAWDGFYRPHRDRYKDGDFEQLEFPHMVLRDIHGKEMWLYGCNCGYGGEGPHGSMEILEKLGFEESLREEVRYSRVVKFFRRKDDSWEFIGRGPTPFVEPCMYRGNLAVMVEYDDPTSLKWLRSFILDPVQLQVFENEEEAKDYGYDTGSIYEFRDDWYPIVVEDLSGRLALIRHSLYQFKIKEHLPFIMELFNFQVQSWGSSLWGKAQDTVQSIKSIWKDGIKNGETEYLPPERNQNYSILK